MVGGLRNSANRSVFGSNIKRLSFDWLLVQILPSGSAAIPCVDATPPFLAGNLYEETMPVRGSSLNMLASSVVSSERKILPSGPTAASWAARPCQREGVPSIQLLPSCI